jgi:hypothetical protein
MSKTEAVAMGVAPVFILLFTVYSGFLAPYSSMPPGWQWIYWLSHVTYAIKAVMINELMPLTWTCYEHETIVPGLIDTCQLSDGHSALKLYDMDADSESYKWTLLLYLFICLLVWNLAALLAVVFVDWSNRYVPYHFLRLLFFINFYWVI